MNPGKALLAIIAIIVLVALAMWYVDFDVSGDVEMPNVAVTGGELPELEADTADIDVETESSTVDVPTDVEVDVETEERTITYPTLDIDGPADDSSTQR